MAYLAEQKIVVIGAGSWGTAIAIHLARIGHDVRLWARSAEHVVRMQSSQTNDKYLPDIRLPDRVHVVDDLPQAVADSTIILVWCPVRLFLII